MRALRFIIVGEGSSDAILERPLSWLLGEVGVRRGFEILAAPWWDFPRRPDSLADRILAAIELTSPCDLVFVHRDADTTAPSEREAEIERALDDVRQPGSGLSHISIVPVRETEAWFLFDESAVRRAAGNPRGRVPLEFPALASVEGLPDPKAILCGLLRQATELPGRRMRGFRPEAAVHRVANLILDFSPLRRLRAFRALEERLGREVRERGWDQAPGG